VVNGRSVAQVGISLALIGATGCEYIEKIQDTRERKARSDALLKVQTDSTTRTVTLRKELAQATWGRAEDFQLQRDDTTVWLWRSGGDAAKDKDGTQLGTRICILNPYPSQAGACKAEETKIGRILFAIEEEDKLFYRATDDLMHIWDDRLTSPKPATPKPSVPVTAPPTAGSR
jgi:hypothetical protein